MIPLDAQLNLIAGIIANVGDGGNEADIRLVEDLAKSYIKKPNCIVLLVISCESKSHLFHSSKCPS